MTRKGLIQAVFMTLGRGRDRESGGTSVEFLLAVPLVLFLFFGIFELGRHYYTRLTLQDAVAQAARFAVTGRSLDDPDNPGTQLTRAESIEHVITQRAVNLGVAVEQITIEPPDGGGPADVVRLGVQYEYDFLFAPIGHLLSPLKTIAVTTAMKNEPSF